MTQSPANFEAIAAATATVPAGRWAIGVSGGADSVALTRLMATREDCVLVLAHLDHQLRGCESDADAAFVQSLGRELNLVVEIGRLNDVERRPVPSPVYSLGRIRAGVCGTSGFAQSQTPSLTLPRSTGRGDQTPPFAINNPSAHYRHARFAFFADVVRRHRCDGVLLAHHADDQAETVLLRLLRGSGLPHLGGMAAVSRVGGVPVRRPLLGVPRQALRDFLNAIGQPWRDDSSNGSPKYRRNVVRRVLAGCPNLTPPLLALAAASRRLKQSLDEAAAPLDDAFAVADLRRQPLLAAHLARQWLVARGSPADRVSPAVVARLIAQALDVTQSPRQHYPGNLLVRRRQQRVDVIAPPAVQSPQSHGQKTDPTADL